MREELGTQILVRVRQPEHPQVLQAGHSQHTGRSLVARSQVVRLGHQPLPVGGSLAEGAVPGAVETLVVGVRDGADLCRGLAAGLYSLAGNLQIKKLTLEITETKFILNIIKVQCSCMP